MPQHVAQAYMQNGTLPVHLLDRELERELEALIDLERKAPIDRESGASDVNESDLEARREGVRAVVAGALGPPGEHAPVILTRVAIRLRLSRLMADQRPDIAVLGFDELTPSINILPLTTISLAKVSGFAEVGKALQ